MKKSWPEKATKPATFGEGDWIGCGPVIVGEMLEPVVTFHGDHGFDNSALMYLSEDACFPWHDAIPVIARWLDEHELGVNALRIAMAATTLNFASTDAAMADCLMDLADLDEALEPYRHD